MSRSKFKLNQNDLLESIANWTEEEQKILERNIINYPADKYTEFKRLALLLTDLQSKRLRDVSLRLQYMKRKEETPEITWEEYIKQTISPRPKTERLKRDSPISSGKNSPRTPKAGRDRSESPSESPRHKKPIIQQRKVVGQLSTGVISTSTNNGNSSIITSQQIKSNDPNYLLKQNDKLLDKMEMLISSNRLYDMKEIIKFYNNCNDIIDLTNQLAKPNGLPSFSKEPIAIQEKDIANMNTQHGNRSFNVPGIGMDLSPRSPYTNQYKTNKTHYITSNGQVHHIEMCTSPLFIESPRNSNQTMSVISVNTNSVSTQGNLNSLQNNQQNNNNNTNLTVPMNTLITQPITSGMGSVLTTTPNINMSMNSVLSHSLNSNISPNLNQNINQNITSPNTITNNLNSNINTNINSNLNQSINLQMNTPMNTSLSSNMNTMNNNLNTINVNNNQIYLMNQQQQMQQQLNPSTMNFNPINLIPSNQPNTIAQPIPQYQNQIQPQYEMMTSTVMNPMYTQQLQHQSQQQMVNIQQPINQMQQPAYTTQFRLVTSEQPLYSQHIQQQTLQRPPKARSLTGSDTMYEQMNYHQPLSQSQQLTDFNMHFDNNDEYGNEYGIEQQDGFISNNNNNELTISHLSK